MWFTFIFIFCTSLVDKHVKSHCIDIHSHIVSQGLHYVPGQNPCVLCICDKGAPKWCKSVLCSPPQNCKSFQVGNSCCEFKCLDDILTAHDGYKDTYDVALRLVASAVTAILSLSILFFVFHRLRRRKVLVHQNSQLSEDQRSLNSIGYITGSFGYLAESIGYVGSGNSDFEYQYEESNAHYSLWKPHGNYFPRGEAPPPYEEAVRAAQIDNEAAIGQLNTSTPINTLTNCQSRTVQPVVETVPVQSHVPSRTAATRESCVSPQYANVSSTNVNVHNNDNSKLEQQRLLLQKQPKVHCSQPGKSNLKNNYVDKGEKSYDKPMVSANAKLNSMKRNKSTALTYKVQKFDSQPYENADKNKPKFTRYENIFVDNSSTDESRGQRALNRPYRDNTSSGSPIDENDDHDSHHKTKRNVSDYQPYNLALFKDHRDINKVKPSRELRNFLYGERAEGSIRILSKTNDKDLPLHRTLPKNLRELIARELPNEVHKSDSDNFICRSDQLPACCDLPLNYSKSHGNIIETIKHAIERTNESMLSKDFRQKHMHHKNLKEIQVDVEIRTDKERDRENRLEREMRHEKESRNEKDNRIEKDKDQRTNRDNRSDRHEKDSRSERAHRSDREREFRHQKEKEQRYECEVRNDKEVKIPKDREPKHEMPKITNEKLLNKNVSENYLDRICNERKEEREHKSDKKEKSENRLEKESKKDVSATEKEYKDGKDTRPENKLLLRRERPEYEVHSKESASKAPNVDEEKLSIISYQCLSSSQDEDDYRSECENCKSSGFAVTEGEETDILNETMTLQRRPLETGEETSYYRTSLTLPTQTRKPRTIINNTNREAWFTSMQETSSSEESD